MKKLFLYLAAFIVLQSCTKNVAEPAVETSPTVPVSTIRKPESKVSVRINDIPMNISVLNYSRGTNTLMIEASNNFQKVELSVSNFYQNNAFSYICNYEVSYSTRSDSLAAWIKYPVNHHNESMHFYDFMPMQDNIVKGDFSVFYNIDKSRLDINADFSLVFP